MLRTATRSSPGPRHGTSGTPQPEIVALIDAGKFTSPVLDAGCGVGDESLELASRGYDVVGIDISTGHRGGGEGCRRTWTEQCAFLQGDVRSSPRTRRSIRSSTARCFTPYRWRHARIPARGVPYRAPAPRCTCWCSPPTRCRRFPFPVPNLVTEAELQQAVSPSGTSRLPSSLVYLGPAARRAGRPAQLRGRPAWSGEAARLSAERTQGQLGRSASVRGVLATVQRERHEAVGEQAGHRHMVDRPGEQEALCVKATQSHQGHRGVLRLDAFGNDL